MGKTKIEWCTHSWSPITGCTKISDGCKNCYAERMAKRLAGRFGYPKDDPFKVTFHANKLLEPTKWRKTSHIFVCSMGDLFHPDVTDKQIDTIFRMMTHPMSGMNHHTYLILTKRPERILKSHYENFKQWKNIWLGVSISTNNDLWMVDKLLQIPANIRFVSLEPMLSNVDFAYLPESGAELDWIIVGGESGPYARPMNPDWVRKIRDQCINAKVPFFMKQMGGYPNKKSNIKDIPKDLRIREYPNER